MKKILIIALSVSFLGMSCTKDITRFNERTKDAAIVPAETLFSNATRNYVDFLASPNVNINIFRFTVGHWAATTYQDEPQYDFATRAIPDRVWRTMYRDVLADLEEAKRIMTDDATLSEGEKANKLAICDIMQVNAYYLLATTFGDLPYTEALDYDQLFPKYDDAKTVYDDLIKRMTENVAALNSSEPGISAAQDVIYGGNVTLWKKFGNSILMRMAMTIVDADAAKAQSVFENADAGAFTAASDNAEFNYNANTPNTNPLWVDLVQSGRQDMVAGKPLLDKLVTLNDPRLTEYFSTNDDGKYVGGIIGSNNNFPDISKPGEQLIDPSFPQVLMGYSEVEFLRAEAIERGFNVPGTAADHYKNGITASITSWGGSAASAATYTSQADVAYATAAGTFKAKIGLQKWIALYNQPVQGWVEVRRLDQPTLPAPSGAKSGYPNRFPYSAGEQQLNPENYKAASAAIGGDNVETKLWWDKL